MRTPVTFTFRHPGLGSVTVAGDFNDWNTASHSMVYDVARAAWTLTIELAPGRYEYKFYVDGAQWWNDVNAPKVPNIWGSENSFVDVG